MIKKQSWHWTQLFTLLNTTNRFTGIDERGRMAMREGFVWSQLTETMIAYSVPTKDAGDWTSNPFSILRFSDFHWSGCCLGPNNTPINYCLTTILDSVVEYLLPGETSEVTFSKKDADFHLIVSDVEQLSRVIETLSKSKAMKESGALVEASGGRMLVIKWFIPLQRTI